MPKIHIFISISYSITVVSGVSWVVLAKNSRCIRAKLYTQAES